MGCALLGLSAAGSGFLGAHMTASIGGADMPVVSQSKASKQNRLAHALVNSSNVVHSPDAQNTSVDDEGFRSMRKMK